MEKTWRWFGKKDGITLDMLRQIGVEGIVTALYDVPAGEVWTLDAICDLKDYIEHSGLRWSVVESLPVPEAVKYGDVIRDELIETYKISLAHLGKAGVKKVCYNFMPAIDWVRTDLRKKLPDGTSTLYFDKIRFAYFDCKVLKRKGAGKEYTEEEIDKVNELDKRITEAEKAELVDTIIVKTQKFIHRKISGDASDPVQAFKELLQLYEGTGKNQLRENLKYFLERVIPVAEEQDITLCIHPDDPPFPVFGLPRVVTGEEDITWILNAVDSPNNGLTFCAGSLSAGSHNDVPALARKFVDRIGFAHLRSTEVFANGDFMEASHLEGRGKLIETIRILEKHHPAIPMRVDHGKLMLDDGDKDYNPGYSFYGRMFALAQVEGMMAVVREEIKTGKCSVKT
jgi:mannonate dehydratase